MGARATRTDLEGRMSVDKETIFYIILAICICLTLTLALVASIKKKQGLYYLAIVPMLAVIVFEIILSPFKQGGSDNDYSKKVKDFADKCNISVELAQSFSDALSETDVTASLDELWFDYLDDYAFGERYRAGCGYARNEKYYRLLVYVSKGTVKSIYDQDNGRKLIYWREDGTPEVEQPDGGSILLVDGVLGEYGKEVTMPSETDGEYTYVWYMVPTGTYAVKNEFETATVFVVADDNSEDVREVLRFSEPGETQTVTVPDGYHIELSGLAEILLTPAE